MGSSWKIQYDVSSQCAFGQEGEGDGVSFIKHSSPPPTPSPLPHLSLSCVVMPSAPQQNLVLPYVFKSLSRQIDEANA